MFLFFCQRDTKKSLPLFLFNKSLPPAPPSQLFNKYRLHFLMQTYSFAVWTRCTKCYDYTTWQNSRKWLYVGAVIKINVLIFHLRKINLWKNVKENEHSLRGFFLASQCTCSLHMHVYSTLPSKARRAHWGVNALCCSPVISLVFHCVAQHLQCTHSPLYSKARNYPSEASR